MTQWLGGYSWDRVTIHWRTWTKEPIIQIHIFFKAILYDAAASKI
jgi:hypothetical protein